VEILGPKRRLDVTTGGQNPVFEEHSPNTANMQYKNVLFHKGEFMDYSNNLTSGGGQYLKQEQGDRTYHFWRIASPCGDVYVAAAHFAGAEAGGIEVGTDAEHRDCTAFRNDVSDNRAECRDMGLYTRYVACGDDQIIYDHGEVTVNGKPWPLHGYPLYESPYMDAAWGKGVIDVRIAGYRLHLDFRNADRPVRRGNGR